MYTPIHFRPKDADEPWKLMDAHPFAALLAQSSEGPFVSHLPMIAVRDGHGVPKLIGHMSRSNEQWRHFQNNRQAVAIFQGPHAYITPRWYASDDVPTWNYAVVHAHGHVHLREQHHELVSILKALTARFEHDPDGWDFRLPSDLKGEDALANSIIGFELEIDRLEPKFKLSQNRTMVDQIGVFRGLRARGDAASLEVAELMERTVLTL